MTDDMAAQTLLGLLPRGRDEAWTLSGYAEHLNWPRRMVEQAVQDLRLEGHPICSGPEGIWLGDRVDLAETVASLRSRMVNQYKTYLALRRTLRRMRSEKVEQTTLFGEAA